MSASMGAAPGADVVSPKPVMEVSATRRYGTLSPLRYPGGKAALAGLFADLIGALGIQDAVYVEPYAGGAGAGVALLREGIVQRLVINDIDPAVHAFWRAVVTSNADLVKLVETTPLTVAQWRRQRESPSAQVSGMSGWPPTASSPTSAVQLFVLVHRFRDGVRAGRAAFRRGVRCGGVGGFR